MGRTLRIWVVLTLVVANAVVGWTVYRAFAQEAETAKESSSRQLELEELIQDAIVRIKRNYVEPVDTEKLVYGAIKGMVRALDEHSNFFEPRLYNEMKIETQGEFGGLGIEITKREDGFITVITPMYGTPAYREGLLPGDRIVKIGDDELRDPDINDVVEKLRGEPGTTVKITIWRVGEPLFDVTLTREKIDVPSVVDPHLVEDRIGYIKLARFQERSVQDLDKALTDLERQGMQALILDLRDNPGGLLTAATGVCDLFIDADPEPRTLVSTRGRDARQDWVLKSRTPGTHPRYPVVVLVNGASASASEIVAGAMKDLGRGILVGTKSYGKGSVQTVIPLGQGTAMSITTALYYTPSGVTIHHKGIEPDIEVKVTIQEELERRRQKLLQMEENIKNGTSENGAANGTSENGAANGTSENGTANGDTNGTEHEGGNGATPSNGASSNETLLKSLTGGGDEVSEAKYSDRQLQRGIDVLKAILVLQAGEFHLLKQASE
ncbi:MAG: S41 family peptidase [Verrucomicrobia bacterium]|nr:S41 family peptidase [Verrucomicrobiota bacterium]